MGSASGWFATGGANPSSQASSSLRVGRDGVLAYASCDQGEDGQFELLCIASASAWGLPRAETVMAVKLFMRAPGTVALAMGHHSGLVVYGDVLCDAAPASNARAVAVLAEGESVTCLDVAAVADALVFTVGTLRPAVHRLVVRADRVHEALTLETRRFIPTCIKMVDFSRLSKGVHGTRALGALVGGTRGDVYVVGQPASEELPALAQLCTIKGHSDWVRGIDAVESAPGEILIATSSQDRMIRLWKLLAPEFRAPARGVEEFLDADTATAVSTKSYDFVLRDGARAAISMEALLIGHDDWVQTVTFQRVANELMLLSVASDTSMLIWSADEYTGLWTIRDRFGELAAQKGATTATGSTGSFFGGHWLGERVVACHTKSGSWRVWARGDESTWNQIPGPTGHVKAVTDVVWEPTGQYLLTSGLDQTTRLWAYMHNCRVLEAARPQIHGYDLNAIALADPWTLVSAADEKVLRVFRCAQPVQEELLRLGCASKVEVTLSELPQSSALPLLGLSNKTVANAGPDVASSSDVPTEEQLQRYTLWPEVEKVYGHGYELSAVAATHAGGDTVVTACKSSSAKHSVIRVYARSNWQESQAPLSAHTLTVTRMRFSDDDRYLVSVSRDRQLAVHERTNEWTTTTVQAAHKRMVLDVCWLPGEHSFVTIGRDKMARIWRVDEQVVCVAQVRIESTIAPTAVDAVRMGRVACLAVGLEDGMIEFYCIRLDDLTDVRHAPASRPYCYASRSVRRVQWRPQVSEHDACVLASVSEDWSLRLYALRFGFAPDGAAFVEFE